MEYKVWGRVTVGKALVAVLFLMCWMYMPAWAMASSVGASRQPILQQTLETYMNQTMKEQHIAGAILVIVKDGKVVLKEGYGYADVDQQKKVDPDETLFRIGSVTKLFTATAAMQQVEQGKLRLDQDVNAYLKDMSVSTSYDTPVTLAELLTQTGGLAERTDGIYSDNLTGKLVPLSQTLKENMPPVIRRPGEVVQYSNYGYTLIGHLVEAVSGETFDRYVQNHIFKPLGMDQASYSLTPELANRTSKGYVYDNNQWIAKQPGSILVYPAGAICATAEDMSRFVLANLQDGQLGNQRILKSETAESMRKRHFTVDPAMPGYGYGFYENYKNTDIVLHDGDTDTFTSQLSMYPKGQIGFFLSYNTSDDGVLREGVERVIYDYYKIKLNSPVVAQPSQKIGSANNDKPFEGSYVFAQRLLEGPLKSRGLFLKVKIRMDDDGTVRLQAFDSKVSGTYIPAGQHLYMNTENGRRIYLKQDQDGKQFVIMNMSVPLQTLEKLSGTEVVMESLVRPFVFGTAALGCLYAIVQFFLRKRGRPLERAALRARRLSFGISLLILLLGLSIIIAMFTENDEFRRGTLIVLLGISIAIIVTSIMLVRTLLTVRASKCFSWWAWGYFALIFTAVVGAVVYTNFLDMYTWL